jgi:hypothetical protein
VLYILAINPDGPYISTRDMEGLLFDVLVREYGFLAHLQGVATSQLYRDMVAGEEAQARKREAEAEAWRNLQANIVKNLDAAFARHREIFHDYFLQPLFMLTMPYAAGPVYFMFWSAVGNKERAVGALEEMATAYVGGKALGLLGKGLGKVGGKLGRWLGLINCFPPETLVATETGLRPIAAVEAGQRVWAYDFVSGVWRLAEVECRHDADYVGPLVTLDVGVGEVTATAYHPFWVLQGDDLTNRPAPRHVDPQEDQGGSLPGRWVNSHDLREGDLVFLRARGPVTVRQVRQRPARTPVCNLTVRDLHTFAVGEMQVLVHNTSGSARAFGELIKDAAANPSKWQVVKKEVVASTNMRNKGGTSVQELLRNTETGEEIVRHTLLKPNGTNFEPPHFREFWK